MNDYYASEEDYVKALKDEEASYGALIFNTMAGNGFQSDTYYGGFHNQGSGRNIEEKVSYAKCECSLYSPNGSTPESVDSMIDKFAAQREFLVTVNLFGGSMDAEFTEEMSQWNSETNSILKHGKQMGEEWVNKNIPKRDLQLSFLNKSNKEVRFKLEKCEIEEKISQNGYLLYVQCMKILK